MASAASGARLAYGGPMMKNSRPAEMNVVIASFG
jgi:hypothetical protein